MTMTIARYFSNRDNTRLPTLHSQNLFALTKEVRIEHQGEEYRLRLTRNNRLSFIQRYGCESLCNGS